MTFNPHAKPFIPVRMADTGFKAWLVKYGVIRLKLGTLSVKIAPSRAVNVWDKNWKMSAAISSDADEVAMNHPNCSLLQDESIRLTAFSENGILGHAYCREDSTTLAESYASPCHFIADDGYYKLLDRPLYLGETLQNKNYSVRALFERNVQAEGGQLTQGALTRIRSWRRHGASYYILYGFKLKLKKNGKFAVESLHTGAKIEGSNETGTIKVTTPSISVRASHVMQDGRCMVMRSNGLRLDSDGRKLCAKTNTFAASIHPGNFATKQFFRPKKYMYVL